MRGGLVASVALLATAIATPAANARPAAAPTQRILNAVSAAAPDDAWAVGSDGYNTLIRHWNGSQWSDVKSPSPSRSPCLFAGVSARTSDDAWAVGWVFEGPAGQQSIIAHWVGHSWSTVKSPDPAKFSSLSGVVAIAADDAWAVGNAGTSPLVLHWDGSSWTRISAPGRGGFQGVTAISSTNVWAVGGGGREGAQRTLVEHWDGTAWTRVKSPNPTSSNSLSGVAAVSAHNIWAVGSDKSGTLIVHWNGHRWRVKTRPSTGSDAFLASVSARSRRNAWAVGVRCCINGGDKTLTLHWNGKRWRVVASPNPSSTGDVLAGVTVVNVGKQAWAVGNTGHSDGGAGALALHWTGTRWVSK